MEIYLELERKKDYVLLSDSISEIILNEDDDENTEEGDE